MSIFDNLSSSFVCWNIRNNTGIISLLLNFISSPSGGTVNLCTMSIEYANVLSKFAFVRDSVMARNKARKTEDYYPGYRHPKSLIGYVVWQYHRFMLSLRDVSELLLSRGIFLSYESIRERNLAFGQTYANEIKRRAPRRGCLVMKGKKHWLWRAVDQEGYELVSFSKDNCNSHKFSSMNYKNSFNDIFGTL